MSRKQPSTRWICPLIAAVAIGVGAGCATKTVAPAADVAPAASSPALAAKRFEWAMNHRGVDIVDGLLADDFQFVGVGTDSAGNPSRTAENRSWVDVALRAMLDPSNQVSLKFDQNLVAFSDTRPGKNPAWHKQIRTSIELRVDDPQANTTWRITGNELIYLTRGDSAAIPPQLLARGVKPEASTWWFERMEDGTLGTASPAATAGFAPTFAYILRYYYSRILK